MRKPSHLAALIAPLPIQTFIHEYWLPQRPVYVAGAADKFRELLTRETLIDVLKAPIANQILHIKVAYTDSAGASQEYGCVGADDALRHFQNGATLCVTALDTVSPPLGELRESLQREFLTPDPILFNCYYSPHGQGFGTHFDQQSVWIMQLDGRKRWRYSAKPATLYPIENSTAAAVGQYRTTAGAPVIAPDESLFDDVTLCPGDMLYLPAGTWHRGIAAGESLALSLTQPHNGFASMVFRLMKRRLFKSAAWRQHALSPTFHSPDEVSDFLAARLAELKNTVAALQPHDLMDQWYDENRRFINAPTIAAPVLSVDGDDVLCAINPLLYFREPSDAARAVVLYHRDTRYTLPGSAEPLLAHLKSYGRIERAAAQHLLGEEPDTARALIDDLLQIGVLASRPTT